MFPSLTFAMLEGLVNHVNTGNAEPQLGIHHKSQAGAWRSNLPREKGLLTRYA